MEVGVVSRTAKGKQHEFWRAPHKKKIHLMTPNEFGSQLLTHKFGRTSYPVAERLLVALSCFSGWVSI